MSVCIVAKNFLFRSMKSITEKPLNIVHLIVIILHHENHYKKGIVIIAEMSLMFL